MTTGYVWHERYAWHDAGGALGPGPFNQPYPAKDNPESKRRIHSLVEVGPLASHLERLEPSPATESQLRAFHTREYIEDVRAMSSDTGGNAGEAAHFSHGGYEVAQLAVGGCIAASEAVAAGNVDNAYALVRPCGHHAEPDRGRGFCIFGNVAVTIRHLQQTTALERIAVVDWDVHHGNGTEDAFYNESSVLTISIHQDSWYPVDRGSIDDIGSSDGEGYNINVPLPPGSGDGAYRETMDRIAVPALEQFEPDMIIISSGYDAAINDPLGRMLCYSETFRAMTERLMDVADRCCDGRLVVCQEGGYSPTYAPFCGVAVLEALTELDTEIEDPFADWYGSCGGQLLQPAQNSVIEEVIATAPLL